MTKYKIGDKVKLRWLNRDGFGGDESKYNLALSSDIQYFEGEIIGIDNRETRLEYVIISPQAQDTLNTFDNNIYRSTLELYNIDPKFLDFKYFWASEGGIVGLIQSDTKVIKSDGQFCLHCNNFASMAVCNTNDNRFLCWSCRSTEKWRYENLF